MSELSYSYSKSVIIFNLSGYLFGSSKYFVIFPCYKNIMLINDTPWCLKGGGCSNLHLDLAGSICSAHSPGKSIQSAGL